MLHRFLIVAFLVTEPLPGTGVNTVAAFGNTFGGFGHHPQMYHAHPFAQGYSPNRHHMFRQQELARQRRAQEERLQRKAEYERYQQQQQQQQRRRQAEYDRYRRQEELQRRRQEYGQRGQQDDYTKRYVTQQPYNQMQQERERDQYRRGLLQQQHQYRDEVAEHEKVQAQYQMKLAAAKKKAIEEQEAKLELERKSNLGRELELRAEKLELFEQSNSTSILETVIMSIDSDSSPPGTRILDDTGEIIYDVNLPFDENTGVMENSEEPVEVVIDAVDLVLAIHSH